MKNLAYLYVVSCVIFPLVTTLGNRTPDKNQFKGNALTEPIKAEILCDCGYRDYIRWKDKPIGEM